MMKKKRINDDVFSIDMLNTVLWHFEALNSKIKSYELLVNCHI